ncbi:hypothetical protein P8452_21744 [Trifolium repens]|nr:63 kDa inner membrane family protein [Trifolium repens]WJX33547.1 hypothetical protein P8452_21744 [Trifolium repens]
MAVLLPSTATILSTPFANRILPLRHHSHAFSPSTKRFLRGSLSVARFGFQPGFIPEPDDAHFAIKELFNRAEDTVVTTAIATAKQDNDLLSLITNFVETVLKVLKFGLSTLHVPNAYGFAIVMLAVLVNAAIFPLTRKQVESDMAMQSLNPQLEAIVKQYSGNSKKSIKQNVEDLERLKLETDRLYKLANFDPLSGFLPVLLTTPVWIGLYQAFSKMADGGPLSEGFFWIPSLSGPTTIAARQNGNGISWLFPFVDGHPLLGWPDTLAYLVLPVLLVVSRYISLQIIPSSEGQPVYTKDLKNWPLGKSLTFVIKVDTPKVKKSSKKAFDVNVLLSLMVGCFALLVPSGLSLYWFTDNILNTLQQIWLQKLGGAKNPLGQVLDDDVKNDPMQI